MKSLFMKNSRCSGTLVVKRFSAEIFGLGKSNSCRIVVQLVAAHFAVDGAPVDQRRQRRRTVRPVLRIERAGDEQQRVAHLLRRHALPVRAPVEAVAGVLVEVRPDRDRCSTGTRRSA